jgi:hypothetical protein
VYLAGTTRRGGGTRAAPPMHTMTQPRTSQPPIHDAVNLSGDAGTPLASEQLAQVTGGFAQLIDSISGMFGAEGQKWGGVAKSFLSMIPGAGG